MSLECWSSGDVGSRSPTGAAYLIRVSVLCFASGSGEAVVFSSFCILVVMFGGRLFISATAASYFWLKTSVSALSGLDLL